MNKYLNAVETMRDNMAHEANENHLWLATHGAEIDKYSGKWIAIDQSTVIAAADTLQELAKKPEVKSARHPLFFLVPKPEEAISIL
jgi:hypothetical protein